MTSLMRVDRFWLRSTGITHSLTHARTQRERERGRERIIIIIINPITARVVGAPQMILQPVFFFFSPVLHRPCVQCDVRGYHDITDPCRQILAEVYKNSHNRERERVRERDRERERETETETETERQRQRQRQTDRQTERQSTS